MSEHERISNQLKQCALRISVLHVFEMLKMVVWHIVRFSIKDLEKDFEKTEDDIKAVQSVGQIIGEVLKQLDDERCMAISSSLSWMLLTSAQIRLRLRNFC